MTVRPSIHYCSWTRRLCAAFLTCVLVLPTAPLQAQQSIQLPDMGGTGEVLPPEEQATFPRDFELYMRSQDALIEDPIISNYFDDMGFRLVMHSDGRDRNFYFHVLRVPGINAFAAPAGVIGINAGLVLAASNVDEVAGVVAHEISHVTQNHLSRRLEEANRISVPLMLATMGLVLAGGLAGGLDGDAAQGLIAGGMGLAQQAQINYTRQNEAEADRIGIQLMARAGYDPNGMVSFFQTLTTASRAWGAGPPEYLRTHPLSTSRVAEAKDRAERLRQRRTLDDSLFHYVQARLRVQMSRHADDAIDYFQAQLDKNREPESAHRYGLALSYMDGLQLDRAEQQLNWLKAREPDRQLFRLLEAELLLRQDRHAQSLEVYRQLFSAYGHSQVVALGYARALLHDQNSAHAALATEILREQLRIRPNSIQTSELLAQAADLAGDEVRSLEAIAENYYLRGGLPQAIEQLERITQRNDLDYYQRARVSARLSEMRTERARYMRTQ